MPVITSITQKVKDIEDVAKEFPCTGSPLISYIYLHSRVLIQKVTTSSFVSVGITKSMYNTSNFGFSPSERVY